MSDGPELSNDELPDLDNVRGDSYPDWITAASIEVVWDRIGESPTEIADRMSVAAELLEREFGPLNWGGRYSPFNEEEWWGDTPEARARYVEANPAVDALRDHDPFFGYEVEILGDNDELEFQINVEAGGPIASPQSPRHKADVFFTDRENAWLRPPHADAAVNAAVLAWDPLLVALTDQDLATADKRTKWQIPAAYRLWLSDQLGPIVAVPEGLTAERLANGTLIKPTNPYETKSIRSTMAKFRKLNHLDSLPVPLATPVPPLPTATTPPATIAPSNRDSYSKQSPSVRVVWAQTKQPDTEIAGRLAAFTDELDHQLGRFRWSSTKGVPWGEDQVAHEAYVRGHPAKDAHGDADPLFGYNLRLIGQNENAHLYLQLQAGGPIIGRSVPHQFLDVALEGASTPEAGEAVMRAVVRAAVLAWEPLMANLTTRKFRGLEFRSGWQVLSGYELWLSSKAATIRNLPVGLSLETLGEGVLVSAPPQWDPSEVVKKMTELREANGIDTLPH